MNSTPDENGYYGPFGGSFIPEVLCPPVRELLDASRSIAEDAGFADQLAVLLRDYSGRPVPLYRSGPLSKQYNAEIFLKREDLNHTGSHKINNTLGQVLLAAKMGKKKVIAETGAGQHGVATASACALLGLECVVFMGARDTVRQQQNVNKMKLLGAEVRAVHSGSSTLKDATNEALRYWMAQPDTYYAIGSVVGPHPYPQLVARFQSVISAEIKAQLMERTGNGLPDMVIACVGGGSNAAGGFYHFLNDPQVRLIGVEAAGKGLDSGLSAATTALGRPGVLHGSRMILMQDQHGQVTEPHSVSAGLDYPGIGPLHAHLFEGGRAQYIAVTDEEALQAGIALTRNEGILPALESAHALAALDKIDLAPGNRVVIILSGRGDKDFDTYNEFMYGQFAEQPHSAAFQK